MVKLVTECLAASSLTMGPKEIDDMLHLVTPATTEPQKCFFKCFGEKTFVLDAAGKPNSTTLKGDVPHCFDKALLTDAVLTECSAKTGATPCEVGYEAGKCLMEKAHATHSSSEEA